MNTAESIPVEDRYAADMVALDNALAADNTSCKDHSSNLQTTCKPRDLACLKRLQGLRPSRTQGDTSTLFRALNSSTNDVERALPEQQIGRFLLKKELGRGGFGVVFQAYDPELDRDVALKVPRITALVNDDLRQRFKQEARAAAGLDHPNIVQVYEAGEAGPICYIVSAYCNAVSLQEWLRQRTEPIPFPVAADLVQAMAGALDHAHQRHVLHRDLKPGNILLQWADTSTGKDLFSIATIVDQSSSAKLIPKITDFGLAKLIDEPSAGTQTGSLLGTPSYMAPEQASGKTHEAMPATDIYALGAILYELLTGRPPFRGETDLDTLHQVRNDEPLAPHKLRKHLPRDLETIVLKCLQKEPARRYPTAVALATDLRHYLAGEPILARPVSRPERLFRWCRRRPLVAGLIAAVIVAVISGTAGMYWQWQRAEQSAIDAQDENKRAQELLRRLTQSADEMLRNPSSEAKGRELLLDIVNHYHSFLNRRSNDPKLRQLTAEVSTRAGHIHAILRQREESISAYQIAATLNQSLYEAFPHQQEYLWGIAHASNRIALQEQLLNRVDAAELSYQNAFRYYEDLLRQGHIPLDYVVDYANALNNYGVLLSSRNQVENAEKMYRRALEMEDQLLSSKSHHGTYRLEYSTTLDHLGMLLFDQGKRDEGEALCKQALDIRQDLHRQTPKQPGYQHLLARSHLSLGLINNTKQQWSEAEQTYRRGQQLLRDLVKAYPNDPDYWFDRAKIVPQLASVLVQQDKTLEAEKAYQEAISVLNKLAKEYPSGNEFRTSLVSMHSSYGWLLHNRLKRWQDAEKQYRLALALNPNHVMPMNNLAAILVTRSTSAELQEALQLSKRSVELAPQSALYWGTLGVVQTRLGHVAEAAQAFQKSLELKSQTRKVR